MFHRKPPEFLSCLGTALLATSVALCIAVGSGRLEESPQMNLRPHPCPDPNCRVCKAELAWLRLNPGRWLGDIADAVELPEVPWTINREPQPLQNETIADTLAAVPTKVDHSLHAGILLEEADSRISP